MTGSGERMETTPRSSQRPITRLYSGTNRALDFCLGILERDGLAVPPFDRHNHAHGPLQQAGLDSAAWRTWFKQVAAAESPLLAQDTALGAEPFVETDDLTFWQRNRELMAHPSPPELWTDSEAVRGELRRLWAQRASVSDRQRGPQWDAWLEWISSRENVPSLPQRLAEQLGTGEDAPRRLALYYLDYAGPIAVKLDRNHLALCVRGWVPTVDDFLEYVMAALTSPANKWTD